MTEKNHLLNYQTTLSIDVAGNKELTNADKAEWKKLWEGISSITPAAGDTQASNSYWADQGSTTTEVTGKKVTFTISGNRVSGDEAQDYVASKFWEVGQNLLTLVKWENPDGTGIIAQATLTSIVPFGGNANAKQTFSFQLAINGQPQVIKTGEHTTYDSPKSTYDTDKHYD